MPYQLTSRRSRAQPFYAWRTVRFTVGKGVILVMDVAKALEMRAELEGLDLIKLKDFHIVKIVDFMPKDATELNKVLLDVSLDSEEVGKILDVTGKY